MRLTNAQLETLRSRSQQTTLYLSIFQPVTIMKCRVNNSSAARGDRTIPYDSITLGSHSLVESGMTMLIGTTEGGSDIGKIRVRSANASQFVVSENSNIAWADNLYISIQKYWELWPVFPRIVANPADEADSIFYKDYDIEYTNQNSVLGTFANAGPHRAIFKGEQAWYSSTGTLNLLGDSLSYSWNFEGGFPTGSTSANPGYVTYNTPGHYVTRLTISGSSGGTDTTYRYVSVYDREGEGNNPPINKWEILSLGGSRDEGGYQASFKVYENVPITENAVVVLFSDNWYGNTRVSIGGNYPNAEKIFWVGYILNGSIRRNYKYSYTEFSAGSISELMKQALGFSVSVESTDTPSRWYELLDMDCRRAIYHYLRWHTTALSIADFQFVGDDRKIQFFDADRTSMWDAVDNFMRSTLVGQAVSDRQGKVWMEVEAMAYENPTNSFPTIMDITNRDWANEPIIDEKLVDELSFLEMGGIAYSGVSTGTFAAILGSAPGNAPGYRGTIETQQGLALLGQEQLNTLIGNVFANKNAPYPTINMDMAINATNLDIAPQETVQVNILAGDTVRNVAINSPYIPSGFDWTYSPQRQILLPRIDLRQLVNGITGEAIIIPVTPEDGGFDTGYGVPGLQIPPLPFFTNPSSGVTDYYQFGLNPTIQASQGIQEVFNLFELAAGVYNRSLQVRVVKRGMYAVSGWAVFIGAETSDLILVGQVEIEANSGRYPDQDSENWQIQYIGSSHFGTTIEKPVASTGRVGHTDTFRLEAGDTIQVSAQAFVFVASVPADLRFSSIRVTVTYLGPIRD